MNGPVLVLVLLAALALLPGCASQHLQPDPAYAPVPPEAMEAPPARDGAIYSPDHGLALFQDVKARQVGDVLTIELVENTNASKKATTSTSKDQSVALDGPQIGGRPVTYNGREVLSASVEGSRAFDGEGSSTQSNSLNGRISVTVARVLPNGNLMVRGEKLLALNQGEEFIRISGIVRASDVRPDNTVPSTKLANARISYGGNGAVSDANSMGWLARFFNSPLWPF